MGLTYTLIYVQAYLSAPVVSVHHSTYLSIHRDHDHAKLGFDWIAEIFIA